MSVGWPHNDQTCFQWLGVADRLSWSSRAQNLKPTYYSSWLNVRLVQEIFEITGIFQLFRSPWKALSRRRRFRES